jgi:hypothetical protein
VEEPSKGEFVAFDRSQMFKLLPVEERALEIMYTIE